MTVKRLELFRVQSNTDLLQEELVSRSLKLVEGKIC